MAGGVRNYYKGRAAEYRVLAKLRREGWKCMRSAQSHSPVDIAAAKDGQIRLIQVKAGSGRLSPGEAEELKRYAEAFNASAELWTFRKRKLTVKNIK
ncbi:MAG: hypothetical protein QW797_09855 [Thermoproteota archaeon]